MADYYKVLEVDHGASEEVILAAYRALAKLHHDSDKKMKSLNAAKDVLVDQTRRAQYDKNNSKLIGNYRPLHLIAEGGFGRTYKGEHVVHGLPVCIKHANQISQEDEEILFDEAKAMWDLRHFGIPSVRDIFKLADNSVALIMSYIPGETLDKYVDAHKGSLDAIHVAWITERVLNILKYLHHHGVVHGDIKPQNIIIQAESHTAVLVDYGLSAVRPKAHDSNKGYTQYFASPEQMRGGTLVPQSDFYSLGMTMVYALGGDIVGKRVPSNIPDAMCDFVKKLIPLEVMSRPDERVDLQAMFQETRFRAFGRKNSGMKPLTM